MHQEISVKDMISKEHQQTYIEEKHSYLTINLGLLSDKPGAGKSLMVLSLIALNGHIPGYLNSDDKQIFGYRNKAAVSSICPFSKLPYYDVNVIIVPNMAC